MPYIPKAKPVDDKEDSEEQKKSGVTTEFDDILKDLDEADIAELASQWV